MSQYHHARGQWPEWPAQVPPAQRPSFSPPGLVAAPTGYEGPADATSVAANYVASQNSFDFNAARIPGLGITDPSPVENNEYSPTLPGWGYTPSDTAAGPAAPAPARRKNHTPRAPMHRSSPREVHRPVPPPRARAAGPPNRPGGANDSAVEEGELSEGQFEDLYEPPKTIDSAPPRDRALIQRALDHDSRGTSENYLPDNAFYEEDEPGEITSDTNGASISYPADEEASLSDERSKPAGAAGRERSGSYSPYLSPREIHNDEATPEEPNQDAAPRHEAVRNTGSSRPLRDSPLSTDAATSDARGAPPFKSVDEAKKEAQKSIMRLFPYGVKYETYINEGFDEDVIKSLFTELGLTSSSAKSDQGPAKQAGEAQSATPQTEMPSQAANGKATEKSEERKDRIARLLAAKASKLTPPATQQPPKAPEKPAKEKTKSAKEQLLQQKIEALQKARDAKAVQGAAPAAAQAIPPPDAPTGPRSMQTITQPAAVTGKGRPVLPQEGQGISPPAQKGITPVQPLSVSELPSSSAATSVYGRKRPVATDFNDYYSADGSLKRQFGQSRPDSSLVIDVSDGSDDNDVEMDMDSPGLVDGQSSTAQRTYSPSRKGLSFRDHPPLSDISQRNYASPSSSVPTPPNGVSNGATRLKDEEYNQKMKEIEEMKRKIAEAEAKKATKTSTPAQTPRGTHGSPEGDPPRPALRQAVSTSDGDKDEEASSQLLAEAASAQTLMPLVPTPEGETKQERRARIVSLQLPKVENSLQEKTAKLRLMQDRVARLQAEIDDITAQRKQLADEFEALGSDTNQNGSSRAPSPAQPATAHSSDPGEPDTMRGAPRSDASPPPETQSSTGQGLADDNVEDENGDDENGEDENGDDENGEDENGDDENGEDENGDDGDDEDEDGEDEPMALDDEESSTRSVDGMGVDDLSRDDGDDDQSEDASDTNNDGPTEALTGEAAGTGDILPTDSAEQENEDAAAVDAVVDMAEERLSEPRLSEPRLSESRPSEPTEAADLAEADHLSLESGPPSPAQAESLSSNDAGAGPEAETRLPAQISDVAAGGAVSEEQAGQQGEEVLPAASPYGLAGAVSQPSQAANAPPRPGSSFTPYESPLRYFRSYRFHPQFDEVVAGGQRSLTFSNKIDDEIVVCPHNLEGEECPDGDECEFQHFESMAAREDQILVELGRSDSFEGADKTEFVDGLKEVLHQFRKDKVRDFDTIAQGIIEFRRDFLEDDSRVLSHLESVST